MTAYSDRPLRVAVMANSGFDSDIGLTRQTLDDKYLTAALEGCGALPIIVPTLSSSAQLEAFLDLVDGIILTGDQSNIAPGAYGATGNSQSHGPFDPQRDASAFYLVNAARKRKLPLLGICRGMQEINVSLGGTIQTGFAGSADYPDHPHLPKVTDPDLVYQEAHPVSVNSETQLGAAIGKTRAFVNSVHVQAVDELAKDLTPVALSDDGIIEAFEHSSSKFIIGVQWHPEYRATEKPLSAALFSHFARLMKDRKESTPYIL
ncbi:gamma-glutamyl-gamma-aminobutyrate hydrolase family protein [Parasedimentitalea huanghaiensis]|uniref:Gamma-glutamyl-gamma-aminobutyrate hydrolase family protein n=1 Tax=Parasedimentitalea huanghaiensis TaxID=2682100 RepID=A0A6L6WH48_9RHOB|nr:gamma-glutamyl-gamma-aminobutyrate hydrolase family protein [Zongyanglinia huanghaiensis]MVO17136.1 gamma-glutamyl-gamma-aminobutyrate hydrolase family protein [Zongyanglinia huanghaiensis]